MPKRLELVPQTTFTFFGAASTTQDIQLIKYIPTEPYVSGLIELRCISRSLAAGQSVSLVLQPISMAEDEPEATYATATGEIVTRFDTSLPSALPGLLTNTLVAPIPSCFRLLVRAIQSGTPTSMSVTVSASLTLRET